MINEKVVHISAAAATKVWGRISVVVDAVLSVIVLKPDCGISSSKRRIEQCFYTQVSIAFVSSPFGLALSLIVCVDSVEWLVMGLKSLKATT